MKALIILGHPDHSSFNHAIAQQCERTLKSLGCDVISHDLYGEEFKSHLPKEEIARDVSLDPKLMAYCKELSEANIIIFIHPNYWGMPPAILKGYIDRVFRPGVAYEFLEGDSGEGIPNGLLSANIAFVFNTSNTKTQRELTLFKDPLETLWKNCIFGLCGVNQVIRKMFNIIITSSDDQRKKWLKDVDSTLKNHIEQIEKIEIY